MNYEANNEELVDKVMDFVVRCPLYEKYGVTLLELQVQKTNLGEEGSTSIEYNGSELLSKQSDINGSVYITKKSRFAIYFTRSSEFNDDRYDMTKFLQNFEQWVDFQEITGNIPALSTFRSSEKTEFSKNSVNINASGGSLLTIVEEEDVSIYTVNLDVTHIDIIDTTLISD